MKAKIFLSLAAVWFLAACPSPRAPEMPSLPRHDEKAEEAKLASSGIATATYLLRSDLSFADAEAKKTTEFKGTSLEHVSMRYSLYFVKQRRVSNDEAMKADSYCELWASTVPDARADSIRFLAGEKLLNGTWVMLSDETAGTLFSLQLQGGTFKSFMLLCGNVLDLEQVRAHVGNVFDITPAASKK